MGFTSRASVLVLALVAVLGCATAVRADNFTFSYSGPEISGSGSLQATAEGGGVFLVTGMSGTQELNGGPLQTITGIVPTSAGNTLYYYDNLLFPTQNPSIDIDGLLFTVTGDANPVNICGAATSACEYTYAEYTYVAPSGSSGDSPMYPGYNVYDITSFTLTDVPEPGSVLLLAAGLLTLMFAARRAQSGRQPQPVRLPL
jgi:PEP-CTERM motif